MSDGLLVMATQSNQMRCQGNTNIIWYAKSRKCNFLISLLCRIDNIYICNNGIILFLNTAFIFVGKITLIKLNEENHEQYCINIVSQYFLPQQEMKNPKTGVHCPSLVMYPPRCHQ